MIQQKIATDNPGSTSSVRKASFKTLMIAGLFCQGLLLSSCASTPAPTEAVNAAELAIATAEQARVADYAAPELGEAREYLTSAKIAVAKKEMIEARRFAEKARINADYAVARANAEKAKSVNEQMQESISTLKQEMQRNTGVK